MTEKLTHQYIIEMETEAPEGTPLDHDRFSVAMLAFLKEIESRAALVGLKMKINTVVYETSYPTPNPEDL